MSYDDQDIKAMNFRSPRVSFLEKAVSFLERKYFKKVKRKKFGDLFVDNGKPIGIWDNKAELIKEFGREAEEFFSTGKRTC